MGKDAVWLLLLLMTLGVAWVHIGESNAPLAPAGGSAHSGAAPWADSGAAPLG